jgi:hypothetical protein
MRSTDTERTAGADARPALPALASASGEQPRRKAPGGLDDAGLITRASASGSLSADESVSESRTVETPQHSPWRVGRKVGRTIYAMVSGEASDEDELIGVMDSRAVAESAVAAHNDTLRPWSVCCGFPVREGLVTGPVCTGCLERCDVR